MSIIRRITTTAVLLVAVAPLAAAARPDLPDPPASRPACTGFADLLRTQGFSAPAAKHFAWALRQDCLAAYGRPC
jgi:hypothetical protein